MTTFVVSGDIVFLHVVIYHNTLHWRQFVYNNYSCILNIKNKSWVTEQHSNSCIHICDLLSWFGYKWFIFRYLECNSCYTIYYIDFTPLFKVIRHLKRVWYLFFIVRGLNNIFDCDHVSNMTSHWNKRLHFTG